MQNEFSTLLDDVKEHILYLQELGVENLTVDLPEVDSSKLKVQSAKTEIPQQRLERFVPANFDLPKTELVKPNIPTAEGNTTRQSLLEATKLTRLPSLPKRNSFLSKQTLEKNQTKESTRENEMPKKILLNEDPPQTLFGDMKETLPDTTETLEDIRAFVGNCIRCTLCESRTKIVHSEGNREADLLFIGEAPGANEDEEGRPFVGKAGQLLNKIIESIGFKRDDVFIGNVNRCRPPQNRQPTPIEAATCRPFLLREIAVVRPKVIVVLGNTATQNLLDTKIGITKIRGEFQDYFGVKVMPTFHPAYLLRDPTKKREVWEDMKKVRDFLNQS
jgi:DNA polymerase